MGIISSITHINPLAVLWIAFVVCRRRFAPRHYLPARGIAKQSRARRVAGNPGEVGLGFGFFSAVSSVFLPAHKPPPIFPQPATPYGATHIRSLVWWKNWGCLCTAKNPSISSSHTGRASRASRVFTATASKKHVRHSSSYTRRASRPASVLVLYASLSPQPDLPRIPPDPPRPGLLRNPARG